MVSEYYKRCYELILMFIYIDIDMFGLEDGHFWQKWPLSDHKKWHFHDESLTRSLKRSHWKKKTNLENSDIIKQGPRVRVCASLTQEVRVTSHLRSIHVLPVQQHHHVLLFNNILINFTILSLISTSISKSFPLNHVSINSPHKLTSSPSSL